MNKDRIIKRERMATGLQVRERADGQESRTIEGCAIVFGQESAALYDDGDEAMAEVIAAEAVTRGLLDSSDIRMTLFHNRELLLARSCQGKGTLSYEVRDDGVYFAFDAPRTADGDKALALVRRGELSGCSFAFGVDRQNSNAVTFETVARDGKKVIVATVRSIASIYDFTLTDNPAYPQTQCSLRELMPATEPPKPEPVPTPRLDAAKRMLNRKLNY